VTRPAASAIPIVPRVPRITSHDHANGSTFVSDNVSSTRFTRAITTMATTFARSGTGRRLSRPSRKTPSSEPNVTPAILNASHRILSKNENA